MTSPPAVPISLVIGHCSPAGGPNWHSCETGLAFVTIGLALVRYFGFGYWTILDGSLVVLGTVSTVYGLKSFLTSMKYGRQFERLLGHLLTTEGGQLSFAAPDNVRSTE